LDVPLQISIIRRWLPLLILSVVLGGGVAYFFTNAQPKVYESKATILVGQSLTGLNPDYNQLLASQRLSATYATIATTEPILSSVITGLGLQTTPARLQSNVIASASPDTALLSITARDGDPVTAAAIANGVAKALIAASPSVEGQQSDLLRSVNEDIAAIRADIQSTQAQIDALVGTPDRTAAQEASLQTYESRLVSLRSTYATLLAFASNNGANVLTVVQPALPPADAVGPRPLLSALLAAMVMLLLVSGAVFIAEYLDDAVKDPAAVDEVLGLSTLARIERMPGKRTRPAMYRLAALLYPRSPTAESYRILRSGLEFATVDRPVKTILVCSAMPSEGKTVTAANLAVVMAQSGRRVLVVDADLRKPGVHEMFNLPNTMGLTDLLRNRVQEPASMILRTELENLEVLGAGSGAPNPAELLGSQRMRNLIGVLAVRYDLVVFDSPPLEVFADAGVLSAQVDGVILVVEARRGRRAHLMEARETLAKAGAIVLGVVLNSLPPTSHAEYGPYYARAADESSEASSDRASTVASVVASSDSAPTKLNAR
jgi:non-specific protein-tyrosine kinase